MGTTINGIYLPAKLEQNWDANVNANFTRLSELGDKSVATVFLQNQGTGKYGLAIQPQGSNFNALYINYGHASDADYGIGIDVGTGANGGILVALASGAGGAALRASGNSTGLIELKNFAGTSLARFNSTSKLMEYANNTSTRWYSDGYSTSVAEIKVDATDAGLGNFFNRGIRSRHVAAATPTGGYSGEIAVGNGKIWVNDAGTWKSAAVA